MQSTPEDTTTPPDRPAGYITPLQRLLQPGQRSETARTLGEALVPYFLVVVETCWVSALLIGLAGVGFLHTDTALLPFWGPPLLFGAALWLFQRVLLQEAVITETTTALQKSPGAQASLGLLLGTLTLLTGGLVWFRIYAGTYFLLDPRWLLSFLNDLFALNDHFFQALTILALAVYFCWRASKLAQMHIEPAYVRRQMWIGLLFLIMAILLRAGRDSTGESGDDIVLVLLIPAFLYCALSAHTLARLSFVRRSHPFGLEGNIAVQERALLSVVGGVGLLLLVITLLGGLFFSTTFFNALQPAWQQFTAAYDWLTHGLSLLIAWLLSPIFSFFDWLTAHLQHTSSTTKAPTNIKFKPAPHPAITSATTGIAYATRFILPFLILLGLTLLLTRALRRRKRLRITRNGASNELHESVWSWSLFWQQFKAFLASLFHRRGTDNEAEDTSGSTDNLSAEPTARAIRAIYRALLAKAATLGYVRRRYETPQEFQQRLNQAQASHNEPQLSQLTTAYTLTRYAGTTLAEDDLDHARRAWDELERKWTAI